MYQINTDLIFMVKNIINFLEPIPNNAHVIESNNDR